VSDVELRPAEPSDLPALTAIYNHYVRETPITFDVEPLPVEGRRPWLEGFAAEGPHRLLVAERGGDLLGYAGSMSFRPKAAYATSVETTVYLRAGSAGQGIGAVLYARLFEVLRGEELHRAYAGITLPNPASIRLHERFGFRPVGVFHEVGRKLGRYWDVEWYEKSLGGENAEEEGGPAQEP
jgi:phosphinothricin acetyltransferase